MTVAAQAIGHGSVVELGTATPVGGAWTGTGESAASVTIAGVTSADFGSDKVDTEDVTDLLTAGTTRVYIPGLEDPGDLSIKLNIKPGDTSQAALHAAKGAAWDYKVTNTAMGFTRAFSGILTSWDFSIPDDKVPTIMAKVKITGPITETNF